MINNEFDSCPCPKVKCKNHSDCKLCIERHSRKKSKPYCMRERRDKAVNKEKNSAVDK